MDLHVSLCSISRAWLAFYSTLFSEEMGVSHSFRLLSSPSPSEFTFVFSVFPPLSLLTFLLFTLPALNEKKHTNKRYWDERTDYDRLRPLSYPDSHVILICFAVDSPDSLDNVQEKVRFSSSFPFLRAVEVIIGLTYHSPRCCSFYSQFDIRQPPVTAPYLYRNLCTRCPPYERPPCPSCKRPTRPLAFLLGIRGRLYRLHFLPRSLSSPHGSLVSLSSTKKTYTPSLCSLTPLTAFFHALHRNAPTPAPPFSYDPLCAGSLPTPNSLTLYHPRAHYVRNEKQWIAEVMHFCAGLPIILVGCKKDLRRDPRVIEELRKTSQRPVTPEEGMAVAQKIGAKHYLECSAKTGEGVREVFQYATRAALLSKGQRKKSKGCLVL
ncbi:hypothetical protein NMY22_g4351 [Coprinellus aureogranulatus]|nr:hypothetical protein NMY22_g4351 [Coprinellus aureogranulatus]